MQLISTIKKGNRIDGFKSPLILTVCSNKSESGYRFPFAKSLFVLLTLSLHCLILSAQNNSSIFKDRYTFISPEYGFIIPHTAQMKHLVTGHSYGGFIQTLKKTSGTEYWKYAYNYPERGLEFFYNNMGNPKALGSQWALSYFCMLPLNHIKLSNKEDAHQISDKGFKHWLGLGIGAGYASRIWNLRDNHQAAVLGSHLNAALTLQYTMRIFSTSSFQFRGGVRITHFSNGAFQIPNLGVNNAGIFIGMLFGGSPKNTLYNIYPELPPLTDFRPAWKSTASAAFGMKEITPPNGKKYSVYALNILQERRFSYKSSIGIGVDVMYNTSLIPLLERREGHTIASMSPQLGTVLSYTLHFNDLELKMQQGFYLLDQWKDDGTLYHRFGLRYKIKDHIFTQLMLKTHFAKADYGEAGIGYIF